MNSTPYRGRSNVSGALALDPDHFAVADDETNALGIYLRGDREASQAPLALSEIFAGEIRDGKRQELDLEGAARIGDVYFWIGSHSTNSEGKHRPARRCLFGMHLTEAKPGKFSTTRHGSVYRHLIADLKRDLRYAAYHFDLAETIAPKEIGGLSIEGLAATPEQGLLIGFRNPLAGGCVENGRLVGGKTLLAPLLNPLEVLQGHAAEFEAPIELDLGGHGIRDIAWRQDREYLIVAGPYHANVDRLEQHRLFLWNSASGEFEYLEHIDLGELNIEAAFFFPDRTDRVELLTDDGEKKGFRCVSVEL